MQSEEPPRKMKNQIWFLLHENAPAHRSGLVKGVFVKNNVTTLEHSQYSPDLAPADFYLSLPALMERCFCDAADIIKNAMAELKRLP